MKRDRAPRPSRLVDLLMRACVLPFLVRRYRVSAARLAGPHHPQAALQNREKLEFYYDNGSYRLDFRNPRVIIRLDEDRGIPFGTRVGHRGPDACPHSLTRGAGKSFAAHYRLTQSSHQILNSFEVLGPAFWLAIGKQL